ncbi:MAG TPA: biotin/lipoyl-binding protein [Gemmataceae bacterium]|nr:biotin/lipoyl-binding protein [Gemmataceae bacterium]
MPALVPSNVLEPRKRIRLRIRADLSVARHRYEGRTYYIVKDPVTLRYYRYTEKEHYLIQQLDGFTTLDEARERFERQFRPDRLPLEEVEAFAQQLLTIGLAQSESAEADKQSFQRRRDQRRNEWLQKFSNILYIKVPITDPDRLLERLVPYCRWIFTGWFMMLSVGIMLAALLLIATHFETFRDRLPSYREFFTFRTVLYVWLTFGAVKVIHEFGHGLSCKAFGGEVHEMGVLFLCLSPCLYCNVSDAWVLPSKWRRMMISFAGIYVELIIAALATFVWWNTPGRPFVNNLCLILMMICSISTVIFNGNPLLRYDGYYVLADWLEIPNLRTRSNQFLKEWAMRVCLGMRLPPSRYMARWRRVLFAFYAITSYIYGWIVTYAVLWFLYRFLEPYRLQALSGMLVCAAVTSMVCWPIYRLIQGWRKRGRLPEMKLVRVVLTAGVLAGVVAVVFLVPLPISAVTHTGLVQLQPDAVQKVFVHVPGILERLHVRDGQRVEQGDILAEFRSLDVENRLEEARSAYDIRAMRVRVLQGEAARLTSAPDRAKLEGELRAAAADLALYARETDLYKKMRDGLLLRAPRAGVVMSPPRADELGKYWEEDAQQPFCLIGDADRPEVLLPVSPGEYRLLRDDLADEPELPVTVRVQGRDTLTWAGRVARFPEAEAKEVPLGLTLKGGGSLAVKPGTPPGVNVPQSQQYLLGIELLEHDGAVCPGTLAQVKIHCRWRTGAWWLWRTITSTFDLELM